MVRRVAPLLSWLTIVRRAMQRAITFLFLSLVYPVSPAWATDGIEPIGLSTQSMIRGGADVAVGDSSLDQINNPATLPRVGRRFDLSGELLMPQSKWRGPIDSDTSSARYLPLGHAGVSIPVSDKVSLGTAIWSKSLLKSDYRMRHPFDPWQRRRVGVDMRDFGLGLNAGVKVTDKLTLGGGLRMELATSEFSCVNGPMSLEFGRGWSVGGGFQLGALYQLTPRVTLGVGYRSPTWFQDLVGNHSDSGLINEWKAGMPGMMSIPIGKALVDHIILPQRLAAGVTWDATDRLRLTVEGRWINYDRSTMNTANFRVDGPFQLKIPTAIQYRDQYAVMTGAEYKLTDHWTIGGGYHFASNPINTKKLQPTADMIVEHHLTTGLIYRQKNWWVGGGYMLGLPNSISGRDYNLFSPFNTGTTKQHLWQMQHSLFLGLGFSW